MFRFSRQISRRCRSACFTSEFKKQYNSDTENPCNILLVEKRKIIKAKGSACVSLNTISIKHKRRYVCYIYIYNIEFLCLAQHATCVLIKNALNTSNIWLLTPFCGPIHTTKYVMPSSGISTSNAFDAFLYCRVSAVFADRSFIMSTLTIHF